MSGQLQTVVELQRALDRLERVERQLAGVPEWMEELHEEYTDAVDEIRRLEEVKEEARRERRKAEGAIADAEAELEHYQEQIRMVRTQREYSALLSEIDTVKTTVREREEEALEALEDADTAEVELGTLRESFDDVEERYRAAQERWEEEKPSVVAEAEELRERVAELRARLPDRIESLYDRIRQRRDGDALAPLRKTQSARSGDQVWHCGACNYRVRLQVASQVRGRDAVVQCDGCKRILYIPQEVPGAATEEVAGAGE